MPVVNYENEYKIFRVLTAIGRLLRSHQLASMPAGSF